MIPAPAQARIAALLGPRGFLDRPEDLALYEYDGSVDKHRPDLVAFPRTTADVSALVKIAAEFSLTITGRGAGTGLSGGSIPCRGGITIAFARMNKILEIDLDNERATLQPGVVNLDITAAVETAGYFYAPDPSSQRACTIGGNVAENAGGPHTLAYGVTTNHVLGLEIVLPDGSVIETGGLAPNQPGYDLTGLFTGSEGTLGLVTKIMVRLVRKPECIETVLAVYNSSADAARTVSAITAAGITPVAIEMLDGVMLRMVEEATHAGYPMDAAAVLLIEIEGIREAAAEQVERITAACNSCAAREVRRARTPEERNLLWAGRKNAFGAVGRVSPTYYVQDGVVPRTKIPQTLAFVAECSQRYGLAISNIFHAGDGNLHPIILFDARKPGELDRARACGEAIIGYCVDQGGSITGEHGVGMEKLNVMPKQFDADSLAMMRALKLLFDPAQRLNPGKMAPTGRGCLEIHQPPLNPGATLY